LAPESIATGFGAGFTTATTVASSALLPTSLSGTTVTIKDSAGSERLAQLYYVSPAQITYVVPAGTQTGLAAVTVASGGRVVATGTARIQAVAPTLFSADSSGQGVAAALALRVGQDGSRITESVFQCDSSQPACAARPIDLGTDGRQVYLLLFGTGIRGHSPSVTATVGGENTPVLAAVPQGESVGLDQVNIGPLPATLAGRGAIDVLLTVDGKNANRVTVSIR
jgi:uncharacterized protein (TIGR03437 family)